MSTTPSFAAVFHICFRFASLFLFAVVRSFLVLFMAASLRVRLRPEERSRITRHCRSQSHDRQIVGRDRPLNWHGRKVDPSPNDRRLGSPRRSPPRQELRKAHMPITMPTSPHLHLDRLKPYATERTLSGKSIISDVSFEPFHTNTLWASDEEAAHKVRDHIDRRQSFSDNQHERKLYGLINSQEPMDDIALDAVMSAVNYVFFGEVLTGRVAWDWSHPSQERYLNELVGSTALRYANFPKTGVETLIILSTPLLKSSDTDRRLVLCAFLHELIHCYLFIKCGFGARIKGGHTKGFETIAAIIDDWIGCGRLPLCNMKANLDHFRGDQVWPGHKSGYSRDGSDSYAGCNQSLKLRGDNEACIFVRQVWHNKHVYI